MIAVTLTRLVASSAAHAFDVVVRHQPDNHPRWEREVVEVRPLDDVVGVGHRTVMVRRERGRTREDVVECVEYVEGSRAAYSHLEPTMDFWIAFDFTATGPDTCRLTVTVRMAPHGALRALTPLFRIGAPRRSARIAAEMVHVIEQTPVHA